MDYNKFFTEVTKRREVTLPMLCACSDENAINIGEGQSNLDLFPVIDINIRLRGSKRYTSFNKNDMKEAFSLGTAQGCEMLLRELHEMQKRYHRPRRSDWGVIVTTGTQEGMSKVFEAIIDKGQPVMVQTPSYFGVHGILAPILPEFIGIEQDGDGIKPEIIENVCDERIRIGKALPKLLYVNPTGSNPSGTVLSEERRRRVYELARKYDFLILEDDPYYFIHFLDEQPASFFSLDTDGRVIRLDSFSKIMSAGIRLGVVTAHKELLTKLIVHVESSIMHTSALSQVLLYKLLESWGQEKLDNHFKDVQLFYRQKRDIMLAAVEKHLTGLAEWTIPQGGMFVWIKVTVLDDVMDLALNKCSANGVFVLPGHAFEYDVTKPNRYLRLCYSYASPDEIEKALSIIAKFIRAEASMKILQ